MPRYTLEHIDDVTILRLEGDVSSRRFWWFGALDALLMRGRRQFVISLEEVSIGDATEAAFVVGVARRIEDFDGEFAFVSPVDPQAQSTLRHTGLSKVFPFVPDVEAGTSELQRRRDT
jgi:anti-anti-sigma factor